MVGCVQDWFASLVRRGWRGGRGCIATLNALSRVRGGGCIVNVGEPS